MLTIWGRLNSHNVKKVAWFAEELGLSYVRHDVGGQFGMSDTYLAMNPNALIPTIDDDGFILWESNAILRYLAARYGGPRWWPDEPQLRALGDRWIEWQTGYALAQLDAFINLIRTPPEKRDMAAIARSALTPWLSGEDFGIGDVPMGVYAHTWFTLDIERPDLPNVADWYRRLQSRPGYASQVMIPLT